MDGATVITGNNESATDALAWASNALGAGAARFGRQRTTSPPACSGPTPDTARLAYLMLAGHGRPLRWASSSPAPAPAALPLAILLLVLVMVVPIPKQLLDLFFVANIAISLAVLMVALNARKPLDFSAFPTVLLFATLFRLGLNVASTRVVLVHGHEGESAAGHVIEAFGTFLIGGDYVVGLFVFAILMIINMIVVTKGAGRVSEVSARFTLDALARQADGDRRRPQRRPDHARRGQGAPRRGRRPRPISTARWTVRRSS